MECIVVLNVVLPTPSSWSVLTGKDLLCPVLFFCRPYETWCYLTHSFVYRTACLLPSPGCYFHQGMYFPLFLPLGTTPGVFRRHKYVLSEQMQIRRASTRWEGRTDSPWSQGTHISRVYTYKSRETEVPSSTKWWKAWANKLKLCASLCHPITDGPVILQRLFSNSFLGKWYKHTKKYVVVHSLGWVQLIATHGLQYARLPCLSLSPRVCSKEEMKLVPSLWEIVPLAIEEMEI